MKEEREREREREREKKNRKDTNLYFYQINLCPMVKSEIQFPAELSSRKPGGVSINAT